MSAQVECTITNGVATLRLANPGRRNAVTVDLLGALDERLTALESEPAVRVIVVIGDGDTFSVGADLNAPPHLRSLRGDSTADDRTRLAKSSRIIERLHRMPQPTVAAIDGACAGAGLSMALACDFRIAHENAVFNTAFLGVGLSGDFGGIWFATRILGAARAKELFFLPGRSTAAHAESTGLVTRVFDHDHFPGGVREFADQLARKAPVAIRAMKRNFAAAQVQSLPDYLPGEVERMVTSFHTHDAREAGRAFLEHRTPVFEGR